MQRRNLLLAGGALAAAGSWHCRAAADAPFPSRAVRIVVPFPPAGINDVVARLVAERMGRSLGQPVVTENRPGANGHVGTAYVARSAPDGHTLIAGNQSTFGVHASLYRQLPYDPVADFAAVSGTARLTNVLIVHPSVGVRTLEELLARVRGDPARHNFASSGNGTASHLCSELLQARSGLRMVHVPYNGAAAALNGVLGGSVQMLFDQVPNVLQHVREGRVVALAVTSASRHAALPAVPTMAEAGVPDFVVDVWLALLAPAHTPEPILARLNREVLDAMQTAEVRERVDALGAEVWMTTRGDLEAHIRSEVTRWTPIVRASGATVE